MPKRLTDEEKKEIVAAYKAGERVDAISVRVGWSQPVIYRLLQAAGATEKTTEVADKIVELYKSINTTAIAKQLGISRLTVQRTLKRRGVSQRGRDKSSILSAVADEVDFNLRRGA